jgi:hypothetical protein
MNITIFTHDRTLRSDIESDTTFPMTVGGMMSRGGKSADGSPLYEFVLSVAEIGGTIAVHLFASWLHDKIKGRSKNISAEGHQTGVEVTEIVRCLEITIKETERRTVKKNPDAE